MRMVAIFETNDDCSHTAEAAPTIRCCLPALRQLLTTKIFGNGQIKFPCLIKLYPTHYMTLNRPHIYTDAKEENIAKPFQRYPYYLFQASYLSRDANSATCKLARQTRRKPNVEEGKRRHCSRKKICSYRHRLLDGLWKFWRRDTETVVRYCKRLDQRGIEMLVIFFASREAFGRAIETTECDRSEAVRAEGIHIIGED